MTTWNLGTGVPIALLPVRLETRFKNAELLVRIYPDTMHVDSHEPELTPSEITAAQAYWIAYWRAGPDADAQNRAWLTLTTQFPAERAAWIARVLRPLDAVWPTAPTAGDAPLVPAPTFPAVAPRSASWTRAPLARALPTHWTVAGSLNGVVTRATSAAVVAPLVVGPDPASGASAPLWMTHFATAEACGMGVRLPLTAAMQTGGLDWLIAYGVDEGGDAAANARALSELFDAHYYTAGFAFLSAGSTTRNVPGAPADYNVRNAAEATLLTVPQSDAIAPAASDAARLADALGLSLTEPNSPPPTTDFLGYDVHVRFNAYLRWLGEGEPNGSALADWLQAEREIRRGQGLALGVATDGAATSDATARALHDALWSGTIGYYLSQLLAQTTGDDAQRFDHRNVIAEDAYLRSLSDQNAAITDWITAEVKVLTGILQQNGYGDSAQAAAQGAQSGDPAYKSVIPTIIYNWAELIKEQRVGYWVQGMTPDPQDYDTANQRLNDEIAGAANALWQARGSPQSGPVGDWDTAAADLLRDRTSRYAYYHWQARAAAGDGGNERVEDWLLGEAAARYSDVTVRTLRTHFATCVRPGGALPLVRVGNQPYGILPVLALDDWSPRNDELAGLAYLVGTLRGLRDAVWLPAVARVPRVGSDINQTVDAAQQTMLQLLGMSPNSEAIFAREQLGRDYVTDLWRFANLSLDSNWTDAVQASSDPVLAAAGIVWSPRLRDLVAAPASAPVAASLVADTSGTQDWIATFAQTLRHGGWSAVRALPDGSDGSAPLLAVLLRHAALREYAMAAVRVQAAAGTLGDWEHIDPELVDIGAGPPTATVWRQLARAWNGTTLGAYLDGFPANDPNAAGLIDFVNALDPLAAVPVDELERALLLFLDSASHRLDAWISSVANARLTALRDATPAGVFTGGYGWVEDLRPASTQPNSDGFIHAPSLAQAVTAAVLRSGYTGHTGGATNPFAVNLTSDRVRTAAWILDGVRQGQTLSNLGGYLVESALHDSGVPRYIAPLRVLAPPRTSGLATDGTAVDVTAWPTTIDGVALMNLSQTNDPKLTNFFATIGDPAELAAVKSALEALDGALDAVADALMTESVHHAVNGSPSRAAATLDALARGDGAVPELEFVRTPRTGIGLTHRVVAFVEAGGAPGGTWPAPGAAQARGVAAPDLNALIAAWLPDPARVRCSVTDAAGNDVTLRLNACALSALDCVYETPAVPSAVGGDVPDAIQAAVRAAVNAATIDWTRGAGWAAGELTFPEFTAFCRVVRAVLSRARALDATDIAAPGVTITPAVDAALASRADAIAGKLRAAQTAIGNAATAASVMPFAVAIGVLGAAGANAALAPTIAIVSAELARRVRSLDSAEARIGAMASDADQVRRIQAVLGNDFLAGPALAIPNDPTWTAIGNASGVRRLRAACGPSASWCGRPQPARRCRSRRRRRRRRHDRRAATRGCRRTVDRRRVWRREHKRAALEPGRVRDAAPAGRGGFRHRRGGLDGNVARVEREYGTGVSRRIADRAGAAIAAARARGRRDATVVELRHAREHTARHIATLKAPDRGLRQSRGRRTILTGAIVREQRERIASRYRLERVRAGAGRRVTRAVDHHVDAFGTP